MEMSHLLQLAEKLLLLLSHFLDLLETSFAASDGILTQYLVLSWGEVAAVIMIDSVLQHTNINHFASMNIGSRFIFLQKIVVIEVSSLR